jgi:hypothetical protein
LGLQEAVAPVRGVESEEDEGTENGEIKIVPGGPRYGSESNQFGLSRSDLNAIKIAAAKELRGHLILSIASAKESALKQCVDPGAIASLAAEAMEPTIPDSAYADHAEKTIQRIYDLAVENANRMDILRNLAQSLNLLERLNDFFRVACCDRCPDPPPPNSDHHVIPQKVYPPMIYDQKNLCCLPVKIHEKLNGPPMGSRGGNWNNNLVTALLDGSYKSKNGPDRWKYHCVANMRDWLRAFLPCCEGPKWCNTSKFRDAAYKKANTP